MKKFKVVTFFVIIYSISISLVDFNHLFIVIFDNFT